MKRIRVLIADDSATMRNVLSSLLVKDPGIEVLGCAHDGEQAVTMAEELLPDVITMDVQMPRMGGLEAIERIMARAPSRILAVCSVEDREVDLSFRAISAGALELIAKPVAGPGYDLARWGQKLVEAIRLMAEVPVVRRRNQFGPKKVSGVRPGAVDIIAIAASTGGPQALVTILAALPSNLPVPILIAQHMAPGFGGGFVRWLAQVTPMKVEMARSGEVSRAGHVYLPPDSHDLTVVYGGVLVVTPNPEMHCPSADRLLSSAARAYGVAAAGLVLTGMGEDGARGLLAIHEANGVTMAQDEESSVVYGMPRAAFEMGATTVQLPLSAIAEQLLLMAMTAGSAGKGTSAGRYSAGREGS
jgi:two-component system chemotaxis response regulator CheB